MSIFYFYVCQLVSMNHIVRKVVPPKKWKGAFEQNTVTMMKYKAISPLAPWSNTFLPHLSPVSIKDIALVRALS